MQFISIPIIISIVYAVIEILKSFIKNENFKNFIPLISGTLGIILSIIMFYTAPNLIPVDNLFLAIVLGLFNGLTATGSNQIYKQLKKYSEVKGQKTNKDI